MASKAAACRTLSTRLPPPMHFQRASLSGAVQNDGKPLLRIMPLGGSITVGSGSTDGTGYRKKLREMLIADGYRPEMLGSRSSGKMESKAHEGWRGYRIDQICAKAKRSPSVHQVDVFTINAGSNDCLQDRQIDTIGDRMNEMIQWLWEVVPSLTILLSSLLANQNPTAHANVLRANEQFERLANDLQTRRKIVFVDMCGSDSPQARELYDGTHPDDIGYERLAKIWRRGFRTAAERGYIPKVDTHL